MLYMLTYLNHSITEYKTGVFRFNIYHPILSQYLVTYIRYNSYLSVLNHIIYLQNYSKKKSQIHILPLIIVHVNVFRTNLRKFEPRCCMSVSNCATSLAMEALPTVLCGRDLTFWYMGSQPHLRHSLWWTVTRVFCKELLPVYFFQYPTKTTGCIRVNSVIISHIQCIFLDTAHLHVGVYFLYQRKHI